MSNGGTQQSFRKYLGAIKDSTTVGLAKVNSDYKELDIAIVRATNHVERPPREKHIKAIFFAISASRPRTDVIYCIHALARRLSKTHNWAVALKTLVVIHRALKEVDPSFRDELISYGRTRSRMLNLSHFKDDSSSYAWDYSAWVRTYALYLDERLECFCVLKYDVHIDPVKTRYLDTAELLVQLPALQQLLIRLLNCQPQGAALYNLVIQVALSIVVSESTKIYNAISEGTINLVDKFFEMQRSDAIRALEIYRRSYQQSEMLSEFYEVCKSFGIGHGEEIIKIEQPPASFLTAMEEYVREAPRTSALQKDQVKEEKMELKAVLTIEENKAPEEEQTIPPPPPEAEEIKVEPTPTIISKETDLLGMRDESPDAAELDNKNALALAIVPVDNLSTTATTPDLPSNAIIGWEMALVSVPSSNEVAAASKKLGGGMDMLTLDSLYDDALRRANQPTNYNPWEPVPLAPGVMTQQPVYYHDPFFASNSYSVQMTTMAQQQQSFMQQQQMMMMMSQQHQLHQPSLNPFGSTYAPVNTHPYGFSVPVQSSNSYASFT